MKEKSLGIIVGILNIILLAVCVVLFLGKDKTGPVITLEECGYVYEEDLPEAILMQGVTAHDDEDGDVTVSVVIEKIVTDREKGVAMITYGASDASGNVAKATRTLDMPVLTRIQFPGAGESGRREAAETVTNTQETVEENETVEDAAEVATEETTEAEETEVAQEDTNDVAEETVENETEAETEETSEENENTENEGEGTTTGGNVTVVGSNRGN